MSNGNDQNNSADILSQREFKALETISLSSDNIGIAGTSLKGPAFVPYTFQTYDKSDSIYNTFENVFGSLQDLSEVNVSQLSVYESFNQGAEQVTFVKGLGAGLSGIPNEEGITLGSGFVVGGQVVSGSNNENFLGSNKFSNGNYEGKVNFICSAYKNNNVVSNNNVTTVICPTNDYLEQIGYSSDTTTGYLINHAVFCPSGSKLLISSEYDPDDSNVIDSDRDDAVSGAGDNLSEDFTTEKFANLYVANLLDRDRNLITDYTSKLKNDIVTFSEDRFNFKNKNILHKGHLVYGSYLSSLQNFSLSSEVGARKHFIVKGSNNQNEPVYENFVSPYKTAKTPWVLSQPLNRNDLEDNRVDLFSKCEKLFRFWSTSDGEIGNNYRIRITPQKIGDKTNKTWSRFSVKVMYYNKKTNDFDEVFEYKDLNLNPNSGDYIGRVIGTEREFYNFKTKKVELEGHYRVANSHLRVEISDKIEYQQIDAYEIVPSGFMPYPRINTSGLSIDIDDNNAETPRQMPIKYNSNLLRSQNRSEIHEQGKYWGVCFHNTERSSDIRLTNFSNNVRAFFVMSKILESDNIKDFYYYSKYFQEDYNDKNLNSWVSDLEDNNIDLTNSLFHLEKILYVKSILNEFNNNTTSSNYLWKHAIYRRDGKAVNDIGLLGATAQDFSYVNIDEILKDNTENDSDHSSFLSFDFFTFGGFDGVNILDSDKAMMNQTSFVREIEDETNSNSKNGPTRFIYNTLHDVITDDANCDIQVLTFPEIGHNDFNKKVSEVAALGRYMTVLNVPEFIVKKDEEDNIVETGILKDYNFYITEPDVADSVIDDIRRNRIVNNNLGEELSDGSSLTLSESASYYYNNKFTLNVCNTVSASIEDIDSISDRDFVLLPSYIALKSVASKLSSPLDSINNISLNESIVKLKSTFNTIFNSPNNNKFSQTLKNSLNSNSTINYVINDQIIKLNSANTAVFERDSLNRLGHNVRIMLDIKKKIKYAIFQNEILFDLNSRQLPTNVTLNALLERILSDYSQRRIIKDYFVSINSGVDAASNRDRLNNLLRTKVAISLYGIKEDESIQEFTLSDVINTIQNNLTEINNQDIIQVNVR